MSDNNALSIYNQFDQLQRAAIALQESGFFPDVKSKAQAIVKVMAGAELGLPPFASMTGIHIIQGKPVLGANVIATLVKNDPRYNYRPTKHNDDECVIEWYENDTVQGTSHFTLSEAKSAGLVNKDNWKKYPSDMLFARAISRGARRFAPGIFGGAPIYTPDEMGVDVDEDGQVIIDSTAVDVEGNGNVDQDIIDDAPPPKKPKKNGKEIVKPDDLVEANLVESVANGAAVINLLGLTKVDKAAGLQKAKEYRALRDSGKSIDEASEAILNG